MTPLEFLKLLWQFKPEELYVLIWTLPDKRSHWYRDIAAAADFVLECGRHGRVRGRGPVESGLRSHAPLRVGRDRGISGSGPTSTRGRTRTAKRRSRRPSLTRSP